MAAVPALLNFQFDSTNTDGCYRVMSRIQGSGDPYVETPVACTPFVPPTLSVPCTVQIGITVDDETCAAVTYEGYVQPCCQEVASLEGRVPFTVTFTPAPACKSYQVTCISAAVAEVTVTTPGTGYNPVDVSKLVTFVDPTGTLATADCRIENGGIDYGVEGTTFTLTSPGVGGANGNYVSSQGIDGTVGPVHAYFDYTVVGGIVTAVNITSIADVPAAPGSGYSAGNTVKLTDGFAPGNEPVITVNTLNTGKILYCGVTAAGTGFSGPTTATVAAPGAGTTALLSVRNTTCNPVTGLGNLCDESPASTLPDIELGTAIQICRKGALGAIPTDLQVVEGGCCADQACTDYEVTVDPAFTGNIYFTDCTTKETAALKAAIPPSTPTVLGGCFLVDSLVIGPPDQASLVTFVEVPCP